MNNKSSMKMYVPGAKQAIDKMKYEIANEQGIKTLNIQKCKLKLFKINVKGYFPTTF